VICSNSAEFIFWKSNSQTGIKCRKRSRKEYLIGKVYKFDVQPELESKFKDTTTVPEISASKNRKYKRHTYIFGKFTAISGLISLV